LYGYKTDEADYVTIFNEKGAIENVLVSDWYGLLNAEFSIAIFVTSEKGTLYALNGDRVLSLAEDGSRSIITYDLEGFDSKVFKVQESVASLEAAIDAL